MKKLTYHQKILAHLKDHGDWVPSYALSGVETDYGWVGSSGERRARELAEDGKLERKVVGKYAYYRYPQKTELREVQVPEQLSNGNVRMVTKVIAK